MTTTDRAAARRSKRNLQGDRSRAEILDAASALMSVKGYSGTSISDLAKQSGLPASSIYWHFDSKAGVLAAVMERGALRFFAAIAQARPAIGPDPQANLLALMRHSEGTVREHPEFLRLFILLLLGSEAKESTAAVVAKVRTEAAVRLHSALLISYAPWGPVLAQQVADQLGGVLLALFDGVFIAGQAGQPSLDGRPGLNGQSGLNGQPGRVAAGDVSAVLVEQMVAAIHALALKVRAQA